MTRPLLKEAEEKELRKIQSHLNFKNADSKNKIIELPIAEAKQLSDLIKEILNLQPIVIEEESLSPNEAAKIIGISRPLIYEMLKNKTLIGHLNGTHWNIQKRSVIEYIKNRDKASRAVSAMDEDGFSLD